MIEIYNLYKTYGSGTKAVKALKGVNLSIASGMFGLLGPNGAGKTTLMRILSGIVNPTQGNVTVNGHNMAEDRERRQVKAMLGYLPQELGLYPDLTARQFIDYMAILKGCGKYPIAQGKSCECDQNGLSGRYGGPPHQGLFRRHETPSRHRPGAGQRPAGADR